MGKNSYVGYKTIFHGERGKRGEGIAFVVLFVHKVDRGKVMKARPCAGTTTLTDLARHCCFEVMMIELCEYRNLQIRHRYSSEVFVGWIGELE